MNIHIQTGGQTGVDRGGHLGGRDIGLPIAGWMPRDGRDEDGEIPPDIARDLVRCTTDGYPARTYANVQAAGAVLLVVRDNERELDGGTLLTFNAARKRMLPVLIMDPDSPVKQLYEWLVDMTEVYDQDTGYEPPLLLLVAGPRRSKWPGGEAAARTIVASIRPSWHHFAGGMIG